MLKKVIVNRRVREEKDIMVHLCIVAWVEKAQRAKNMCSRRDENINSSSLPFQSTLPSTRREHAYPTIAVVRIKRKGDKKTLSLSYSLQHNRVRRMYLSFPGGVNWSPDVHMNRTPLHFFPFYFLALFLFLLGGQHHPSLIALLLTNGLAVWNGPLDWSALSQIHDSCSYPFTTPFSFRCDNFAFFISFFI